MDRLMRARVLLAEAEAVGLTIDDLVAAASTGPSRPATSVSTLTDDVETVAPSSSDAPPRRTGPAGGSPWPAWESCRSTPSMRTTARWCWPMPCVGRNSAGRAATGVRRWRTASPLARRRGGPR